MLRSELFSHHHCLRRALKAFLVLLIEVTRTTDTLPRQLLPHPYRLQIVQDAVQVMTVKPNSPATEPHSYSSPFTRHEGIQVHGITVLQRPGHTWEYIKMNMKKQDVEVLNGFKWPRIGSKVGLL
jgi:hypothetical protein